ncbi:FAD-dependent oxidoreductase [candidate division WOR-3 bacterium]|uniref:FAD-dependent oxidoreductase n=1 Tax=candidate division WOR-3 bacterium TaxID=2052148 RepID=A0A937XFV2_UNCW3|nr:FAD-dependent oxidoreductase [candidate division WOR-3 bacterium]
MKQTDVAIVGGGPAGLCAAIAASRLGAKVVLIDDNDSLGGQLVKQTHKFFGSKRHYCGTRGMDIAAIFEQELRTLSAEILPGTSVVGLYPSVTRKPAKPTPRPAQGDLFAAEPPPSISQGMLALASRERFTKLGFKCLIVATGAAENNLLFENNDLPGVYGAGAVQTLMNVHGVKPGTRVLMVGSGNIGLIVSYQLIQASIEVAAVVEALPRIGGYHVHAAKLARLGVPILTSHTVLSAVGKEEVEGAVICRVGEDFKPLAGTARKLQVDTICLAVGLTPLSELLWQSGCRMVYVPELGGHVAWHNQAMQTSLCHIYLAGDVSGIEEASTAMLEGRVAGAHAAAQVIGSSPETEQVIAESQAELCAIRQGPFGDKAACGKAKLAECALLPA